MARRDPTVHVELTLAQVDALIDATATQELHLEDADGGHGDHRRLAILERATIRLASARRSALEEEVDRAGL